MLTMSNESMTNQMDLKVPNIQKNKNNSFTITSNQPKIASHEIQNNGGKPMVSKNTMKNAQLSTIQKQNLQLLSNQYTSSKDSEPYTKSANKALDASFKQQ